MGEHYAQWARVFLKVNNKGSHIFNINITDPYFDKPVENCPWRPPHCYSSSSLRSSYNLIYRKLLNRVEKLRNVDHVPMQPMSTASSASEFSQRVQSSRERQMVHGNTTMHRLGVKCLPAGRSHTSSLQLPIYGKQGDVSSSKVDSLLWHLVMMRTSPGKLSFP